MGTTAHRTKRPLQFLLVGLMALSFGGHAAAQTRVVGGDFRRQDVQDQSLLQKGRIELGLNFAGVLSFNSVTPEGGDAVSQRNIYVVPGVVGGYMVTDNIEVRAGLGFQYAGASVGGETTLENYAGVFTLQGLYQKDFTLGLGGYAGIGAGGFFGSRNQPNPADGSRIGYSSVGGLGQLLFGLLMQPGPRLILRGGFRMDALFGSDSPETEGLGIDTSFFNVQILAEFMIGMRFGGG